MLRTLEGGVQGTPVAAVLWLDADAVFLHENGDALATQLEAHGIVGGGRGPDILLSGDRPSDLFVNTGVMVVRNTPYARAWLRWFISLNASRPGSGNTGTRDNGPYQFRLNQHQTIHPECRDRSRPPA